jgi:hypothetical protein
MTRFHYRLALFCLNVVTAFCLFICFCAHAQVLNTDQIGYQTNGGLSADTNKKLIAAIYRGTSAPGGPLSAGMLWLDTNTTPPILKEYTGSVWNIPLTPASVATQADTSSFPGAPTDGQIIFSAAPPSLWVYSSTLGAWATFAMPMVTSAANIRDVYTAAVIATVGAPTVGASATAGSLSAGAYKYQVTCRNSTGGETTGGTTSASVSPGSSKSTDLSAIPTCATGGVTRNIYRTKANGTSPFYWVANIADNTTTTLNDGLADASAIVMAPDVNFSAALPGSWTITNLQTKGGCGGTGATRGSMVCYNGTGAAKIQSTTTDGAVPRGNLSIASYSSGNYTMQWRIKQVSQNGDTYQTYAMPPLFGMRTGTGDNAISVVVEAGYDGSNVAFTAPPNSSNHPTLYVLGRSTTGGSAYGPNVFGNPFPEVDAWPLWVRIIRRGSTVQMYTSANATDWQPYYACTGTSVTNAQCGETAPIGSSSMDHVELPIYACGTTTCTADKGPWLEIDSFTLTVN